MLTHQGTQPISTKRLLLRRYTVEDAEAMYQNWASDPTVTRFLTWEPHASLDVTRALLADWCAAYARPDNYNWVIELDGTPIGNISVVRHSDRDECAELGYCMGTAWWGKGLMTEAAGAVIDFLFSQAGFHRVSIRHAVENPGSGRVARKCGMRFEGISRESFRANDGAFLDIACYGLLRDEWERERKREPSFLPEDRGEVTDV